MNRQVTSLGTPERVRPQPEHPQPFSPTTQLRSAPVIHGPAAGQRVIRGAVAAAPRTVSSPVQKERHLVAVGLNRINLGLQAAEKDLRKALHAFVGNIPPPSLNEPPDAKLARAQIESLTEQQRRLILMGDKLDILEKNKASSDPKFARWTDSNAVVEARADYNSFKSEYNELHQFYNELGNGIQMPDAPHEKKETYRLTEVWDNRALTAGDNIDHARKLLLSLPRIDGKTSPSIRRVTMPINARLAEAVINYHSRLETVALRMQDLVNDLPDDPHATDSKAVQARTAYNSALAEYKAIFGADPSAPSPDRLDSDNNALALALRTKRELPAAKRSIDAAFRAIADPRRELPSQALKAVDTLKSMRTAVATIGKLIEGGIGPNAVAINRAVNTYDALRRQLPRELASQLT